MTALDPAIFDDPFHAAAWAAFVVQAALAGGPPDMEATRRQARRTSLLTASIGLPSAASQ